MGPTARMASPSHRKFEPATLPSTSAITEKIDGLAMSISARWVATSADGTSGGNPWASPIPLNAW